MIVLLPGPPHELKPMFLEQVEPRLKRPFPACAYLNANCAYGHGRIATWSNASAPIYTRYKQVQTTILAAPGEIQIHLRMWTDDAAGAKPRSKKLSRSFELALGDRIFATRACRWKRWCARALTMNHATIATAESCTGGLLAERLTRIPGSSTYFLGGVVCYSNELKTAWAEVPAELIDRKGRGERRSGASRWPRAFRRSVGSTLGVGITGIAGPGGGSEEKPVGTVHIALARPRGHQGAPGAFARRPRTRSACHASQLALDMVRVHFLYDGKAQPRRVPSGD